MKNKKMHDIMSFADDKFISEADPSKIKAQKRAKKFNWTAFLAAACCFLLILNLAVVIPLSLYDNDSFIDSGANNSVSASINSDLNHIQLPQQSTSSSTGDSAVGGDSSSSAGGTTDTSIGDTTDTNAGDTTDTSVNDTQSSDTTPSPVPSDPGAVQFIKSPELIGALDRFLNKNANNDMFIKDAIEETLDKVQEELEDKSESLDTISPDINDNQVQGVSEADIAKRSDKFLYYLRGNKLFVYSLNGNSSDTECIFPLSSYINQMSSYAEASIRDQYEKDDIELSDKFKEESDTAKEMFLSQDFKTLTLIISASSKMTGVFVFDVSKAPSVTLKSFHMMSGKYVSSRMINGELLLFTKYSVSRSYNEDKPKTYIPYYVSNDVEYLTNDIYFPSKLESSSYLTVTRLSQFGTFVEDSLSYLSFGDVIYVSHDNVFLTRRISLTPNLTTSRQKYNTEIVGINYSRGSLIHNGSVFVKGHLNNQYSLDEHEGILRVVTTSFFLDYSENAEASDLTEDEVLTSDPLLDTIITDDMISETEDTSASLYCIDLSSWQIRASVENFAPKGEIVRSVRFEGTNAYVCTSLQQILLDPVFFFDLSDLDNITYTQTGEFDGYSSSLINFGDGYVVGVGYGDTTSTLKIDVYKEKGNAVEIVCSYVFDWTLTSHDYKSYFIDRERHLIGIGISSRIRNSAQYEDYYILLHFNGSYFDFVLSERVDIYDSSSVRSFLLNGFVYVVTDTDFKVFQTGPLNNLPFIPEDEEVAIDAEIGIGTEDTSSNADPSLRDLTKPAW